MSSRRKRLHYPGPHEVAIPTGSIVSSPARGGNPELYTRILGGPAVVLVGHMVTRRFARVDLSRLYLEREPLPSSRGLIEHGVEQFFRDYRDTGATYGRILLASFVEGPLPPPDASELLDRQRDTYDEYSASVNTGLMMSISPNTLDDIPPYHAMQVSVGQPDIRHSPQIAVGLVHTH